MSGYTEEEIKRARLKYQASIKADAIADKADGDIAYQLLYAEHGEGTDYNNHDTFERNNRAIKDEFEDLRKEIEQKRLFGEDIENNPELEDEFLKIR